MKSTFLSIICLFILSSCVYQSPLTESHEIKIDQKVLGLWQDKNEGNNNEKMMILRFSDTEYLIHYPVHKDDMYFRAYPIKIGDHSLIQLEIIGNHEGALQKDEKYRFTVSLYKLIDGELEIRNIKAKFMDNPNESHGEFKDINDLKKAILSSKDNDINKYFEEPGRFTKVEVKR